MSTTNIILTENDYDTIIDKLESVITYLRQIGVDENIIVRGLGEAECILLNAYSNSIHSAYSTE